MYKEVKGDLLKAFGRGDVNVIGHQANCMNTMKSGIAKQIVEKYPLVATADYTTTRGDREKLGTFTKCFTEHGYVFNLYGQYHFRPKADGTPATEYDALRNALREMARELLYLDLNRQWRVGFPRLGCGLAGGDWKVVSKIIKEEMRGINVTVYYL